MKRAPWPWAGPIVRKVDMSTLTYPSARLCGRQSATQVVRTVRLVRVR